MPSLSLSRLIVAILIATAIADVVTRGSAIDALSFRAWEAMSYHHPPGTAFEPSHRYDRCSYGDLANMGNLREYRVYRREVFTTDAYGFRNPPGLAESGRVRAILIGDSFSAGSGVSDHQTLSAQLTSLGLTTYNVAPMRLTAAGIRAMAARLRMEEGWILYQQATGLRYVYLASAGAASAGVASAAPAAHPPVGFVQRFRNTLHHPTWPMRIAADRWLKSWRDDRWFANTYKDAVDIRKLINGDTMLFFPNESIDATLPPVAIESIGSTVQLYRGLQDELASTRFKLAVVLVPDRYSAYAHLMAEGAWTAGMPPYQRELEKHLEAAGVPVISLYTPLARRATEDAARWEYVYWQDDTHWNPSGIRIAATEVHHWIAARGGIGPAATAAARPAPAAQERGEAAPRTADPDMPGSNAQARRQNR